MAHRLPSILDMTYFGSHLVMIWRFFLKM